jgi:hypothetical protein
MEKIKKMIIDIATTLITIYIVVKGSMLLTEMYTKPLTIETMLFGVLGIVVLLPAFNAWRSILNYEKKEENSEEN